MVVHQRLDATEQSQWSRVCSQWTQNDHFHFLFVFLYFSLTKYDCLPVFFFVRSDYNQIYQSWWLSKEIRFRRLEVESVCVPWCQAPQHRQISCEVYRMYLVQWFGWHEPLAHHAESKHRDLPRVAEWIATHKALAAAKREQKEYHDRKLIQKMKVNGLDGFLRSVQKKEVRHAPPNQLLKQWRFPAPPALAITKAIANFLLLDGHPASIVEGEGFQQLMKLAEPRYVCPSRTYFQHVSNDTVLFCHVWVLYACLCRRISLHCTTKSNCFRNRLCMITFPPRSRSSNQSESSILPCPNPYHPISFTTDMWTGPDHESYICLTAHWFDSHWQLQHALLDILLCTDRHTGENLVEWIKQVSRANDLFVCSIEPGFVLFMAIVSFFLLLQRLDAGALTHDHGADVTKAARLSGIHDFQCFDHELDLTVHAGLDCPTFASIFMKASNLVSTIRSSPNLYRKLRDDQVGKEACSWCLPGFICFPLFV